MVRRWPANSEAGTRAVAATARAEGLDFARYVLSAAIRRNDAAINRTRPCGSLTDIFAITYNTFNMELLDRQYLPVHPLPVVTIAVRREHSREIEAGL